MPASINRYHLFKEPSLPYLFFLYIPLHYTEQWKKTACNLISLLMFRTAIEGIGGNIPPLLFDNVLNLGSISFPWEPICLMRMNVCIRVFSRIEHT